MKSAALLLSKVLLVCLFALNCGAKPAEIPTIVLISGETEFQSQSTLPAFRKFLETRYGFHCFYLERETTNDIRRLEILDTADLVVLFVRRMTLPDEQLNRIKNYLDAGKPLIALRTSGHAFEHWQEFDREVLGGNYQNRYSDKLTATIRIKADAGKHPILKNVPPEFSSDGSLYKMSPIATNATVLLIGSVTNSPPEPVAWIHTYHDSKVFYTSLGHPQDFENPAFRQLLVNAIHWALNLPAPKEKLTGGLPFALVPGTPKKVGVAEFERIWKGEGAIVLDVRSKSEFEAGHIPGALNADVNSPDFTEKVSFLDKSAVYLVHCAAGIRSALACKKMNQMGFKYLVDLEPGFNGWQKARKPVEK